MRSRRFGRTHDHAATFGTLGTFRSLGTPRATLLALLALFALLAFLFAGFPTTSDQRGSVDGVEGELFDNADFAHTLNFYSFSGL